MLLEKIIIIIIFCKTIFRKGVKSTSTLGDFALEEPFQNSMAEIAFWCVRITGTENDFSFRNAFFGGSKVGSKPAL